MKPQSIRETVQKIDARLTRVEQFLPALATKTELREAIAEAIAPLATKTELQEAIAGAVAPLATKAELQTTVQAAVEETRRHMDVVSEATRYEVHLLADGFNAVAAGQRALAERVDRSFEEIKGVLVNHEGRLSRLESERRS
jgi:hypothetical protein